MIRSGSTYIVMGLFDRESIAWAVGENLRSMGARVVYTVQNEIVKKRYLDRSLSDQEQVTLEFRFCDATNDAEVAASLSGLDSLSGVVHSVAYANPKTCMGEEFHTDATSDILKSYEVSAVSLATVAKHAAKAMPAGGSIVALTFDTRHAYPLYNWMGVHKAALEALVRALARRHGRDGIRVNAVSSGPLATFSTSRIPGFDELVNTWTASSLLPWDPVTARQDVADAVAFLLGPYSRRITGHVLPVDGGAAVCGGELLDFEKPSR
jgi:enoyl-[acyl-carrier-protein] reductase (NADH)